MTDRFCPQTKEDFFFFMEHAFSVIYGGDYFVLTGPDDLKSGIYMDDDGCVCLKFGEKYGKVSSSGIRFICVEESGPGCGQIAISFTEGPELDFNFTYEKPDWTFMPSGSRGTSLAFSYGNEDILCAAKAIAEGRANDDIVVSDGVLIGFSKELEKLDIPEGVTRVVIPGGLDKREMKFAEMILPSTVTKLCKNQFECLRNIKKVTIRGNVEVIPGYCFSLCEKLEEVILPDTVRKIENDAFGNTKVTRESLSLSPDCKVSEYAFR